MAWHRPDTKPFPKPTMTWHHLCKCVSGLNTVSQGEKHILSREACCFGIFSYLYTKISRFQWPCISMYISGYMRLKVRSHCVRVRISFSIRFSFRVRRTVYTESEFLSVFDLISCPQLPRQTSKCDFVSGLARFGWKRTSVSVFHGRGTDRNGTDANLMALNRRLIRKLMQSKHCF